MLDASLVIIEVISTSPRAPSVQRQREMNREDGTAPEREFEAPEGLGELPFLLKAGEQDVVAIAHPKVFGGSQKARAVLEAVSRSEATVKLPNQDPMRVDSDEEKDAFLVLAASTPWGRGTRKQLRNPGRPHKHKQPNEQQLGTYRRMWFGDRKAYPPRTILQLASDELGRNVEYWELKNWFGPSRDPARNKQR